jgi:hypothetical protein
MGASSEMKNYAFDDHQHFKHAFMSGFGTGYWDRIVYYAETKPDIRIWRLRANISRSSVSPWERKRSKICKKAHCRVRLKNYNHAPVKVIAFRVVSDHPAIARHPKTLIFPTLEKAIAWTNRTGKALIRT